MMLTAVIGILVSFTRTPVQPYTAGVIGIIVFIIFSTISSTLGLEIVVYYIYTFATSWDVYQSSSSYKNIAFVTFFLAIVEVIIGLVAATFGYLFSFHERHERTGPSLPQTRVAPMDVRGEGNDGISLAGQQQMNQTRARLFLGASTSNGEGEENGGTQGRNDHQPTIQLNSPRQYVAGTRTVYKHISDGREWGLERNNTDGRIYYYNIEIGERRADLPPIALPRAPRGYRIENREVLRDEYHDEEWLILNGNGEQGGYCQVIKGENRVAELPQ